MLEFLKDVFHYLKKTCSIPFQERLLGFNYLVSLHEITISRASCITNIRRTFLHIWRYVYP